MHGNHDNPNIVYFPAAVVILGVVISLASISLYSTLPEAHKNTFIFGISIIAIFIVEAALISLYRVIKTAQEKSERDRAKHLELVKEYLSLARINIDMASKFVEIAIEDREISDRARVSERTRDVIWHWDSLEMFYLKSTMQAAISKAKERGERLFTYLSAEDADSDENSIDKSLRAIENQAVIGVLNFLEKVSRFTFLGQLDEDELYEFYHEIFYRVFQNLSQFIDDRRESKQQSDIFENFEKLAIKWRANNHDTDAPKEQ